LALFVLCEVYSKEITKVMDLVYIFTEPFLFRENVDLVIWWKWMKLGCVVGIKVGCLTNMMRVLKGFIEISLRLRCVVWNEGGG
jgi:hypothetical protein